MQTATGLVVFSGSKIMKLKAIHNCQQVGYLRHGVVFSGSKIMKLKAIHNVECIDVEEQGLCSVGQR